MNTLPYRLFLLLPLALSALSATIDENKLWLPRSFSHHQKLMLESAEKAANARGCNQFIRGEIVQDESTKDEPIFKFICRDDNGSSFRILINGITGTVDNPIQTIIDENNRLAAEAKAAEDKANAEAQAKAEKEALEAKIKAQAQYWDICHEAIKKRIVLMKDMTIVSRMPPIPVISTDDTYTYSINFNATSSYGKTLAYRASCHISGLDEFDIKIKARR